MAYVSRSAMARILRETADLLELKGENPFRSRAYANGARAIEGLTDDPLVRFEAGTLAEVQGIGPGLVAGVAEILLTGKLALHEELISTFPHGVIDLLKVPGLGAKRLRTLIGELRVDSPAALERACREGRVAALPGFGAKSQEKLLVGLATISRFAGRYLLPVGVEAAENLLLRVRSIAGVRRVEVAGSIRRRLETVGNIDLVATVEEPVRAQVSERFAADDTVLAVLRSDESGITAILAGDIRVELRFVEEREFECRWLHLTGAEEHLEALRDRARTLGLELRESGLYDNAMELAGGGGTEKEIYARLELPWFSPELRENSAEGLVAIGGAAAGLVELSDLRGTFHVHTTWSDGIASIAEMASAASRLGWEYLGITDHSRAAAYAGGLDAERVRQQWREIDDWNASGRAPRLFKGTECDIVADGALDYDDDLLLGFDYVVASIHSRFSLSREAMTARLVRAVSHPCVTFLGHPTGRLLLAREPYEHDLEELLKAAARHGVIVELNANPHRLDLDWRALRGQFARRELTSIHPDAHSPQGLADVRWGVEMARKAGASRRDIFNTRALADVEIYLRTRHSRAQSVLA